MSKVLLLKVVVSAVPFHFTIEFPVKPVPFTVKVNAVPPTVALAGVIDVIAGVAAVMVKVSWFDERTPL
jgi:hypothetical protein